MLPVKNVGKPCEGKPHARFDEGLVVTPVYSMCVQQATTDYTDGNRSQKQRKVGVALPKGKALFLLW